MTCDKCGKQVRFTFRDRPVPERCQFVCYDCLDDEMRVEADKTMSALGSSIQKRSVLILE